MATWTLRTLLGAAGIDAGVSDDTLVEGLGSDSRTVQAGDLFCCVTGANADGHDFAAEAAEAGAAALLVSRELGIALPQARVSSVRVVLGPLADTFFGHPSGEMAVAAVTGTNGKTTVTYLLESIARAAGGSPGVVGTVSRRYGSVTEAPVRNTPEAIDFQRLLCRMRDAGTDVVVVEATSDGLEQGRLRGTTFATAAFTNLTQDHLNTHGSMEAYFAAKASLFDPSYTKHAVINVADEYGSRINERVRGAIDVITFGAPDADIECESADVTPEGSLARIRTPHGVLSVETSLRGRYNVDNCMCAAGMALQLGFGADDIVEGLRAVSTVPGRLEPVDAGQDFLVLVDYAHTPDALEHALRTSRELARGRLIVVFGCGGDRDRAKRPLMGEAATRAADLTFITSDNPRSEDPMAIIGEIEAGAAGGAYRVVADRREAIAEALDGATAGDVVLVAGKGHEQGQTFGSKTLPFDDREVVREIVTCRT
jgi:UDP-N-acetylmuramoyl-L-alanyl-D-glutamate--2,6-diaminopimelate ligase